MDDVGLFLELMIEATSHCSFLLIPSNHVLRNRLNSAGQNLLRPLSRQVALLDSVCCCSKCPMYIYKFLRFVENVKNFRKLRDVETFGAFDFLKIVLSSMQATIQL